MRSRHLFASVAAAGPSRSVRANAVCAERLESRRLLSVNVLNYRYDTASDGLNSNEVQLTPTNVKAGTFGKQFTVPVDGQVYAEPLVNSSVTIAAGVNTTAGSAGLHSVVFVATENDSLYAISTGVGGGKILWHRSFLNTANSGGNINNTLNAGSISVVTSADVSTQDISPVIGITSTPVIDGTTGIMYVVGATKEVVAGTTYFVQRLHAINIADGTDAASPYLLGTTTNGSVNQTQIYAYGTGEGSVTDPYNGTGKKVVQFSALRGNQRAALSLVNGNVYIAWASHGDNGPYQGWLVTVNVSNLKTSGFKLDGVLCTCPNNGEAGIWQSGGAVAFEADDSAFYFMTGNGTAGAPTLNASGFPTDASYNEAVVKAELDPTTTPTSQGPNGWGIKIVDYFIPYNVKEMDAADSDFGSGAPLLLPASAGIPGHPDLLIAGGKDGRVYVLDRNNLGHYTASGDPKALNSVLNSNGNLTPANLVSGTLSTPTYANGHLYLNGGYGGNTTQFTVSSTGQLVADSQTRVSSFGYESGGTEVSSDGTSDGIVWTVDRGSNEIHAYDAQTLATELWNSNDLTSDNIGGALVKFAEPTIANGELFVGTSSSLVEFGLVQAASTAPSAPVLTAKALSGSSIGLTWTDSSAAQDAASVYLIDESVNGGAFTQVATAPAGATSIAIGGLQALTNYSFKIAGQNAVGQSAFSNIASAETTNQSAGIDFSSGFAGETQFTLNGTAAVVGADLNLTSGKADQSASAFFNTLLNVSTFTAQFAFQISAGTTTADGFTFTLQDAGPTALGPGGGGLGYGGTGGINHSVAIKFDLYNNSGEGPDSTGLFSNGKYPTVTGSVDLSSTGINLHSGDPFLVNLAYDGTTLTETVTDSKTSKSVTETYTVNIPSLIGSSSAYVGFTGGSGGLSSTQNILNFTFSPSASTSPQAPVGLGATPATATSVNLVWTNDATNQTGYLLDRATNAAFTQNLVTQTLPANPASFTDSLTGLAPGGTYYYRLRAFNSAGPSGNSNVASVTIPLAPPKPTNQLITKDSSNEIDIIWQDNAGHSATDYQILRAENLGAFVVVADLPPTSRPAPSEYGWADTTVTPGNYYEYHILAVNTSGHNDFAGVNATTPPAGWSDGDIGSPTLNGSALYSGGVWTVAGNGADIWNTSDQLNFVSQSLTGNGSVVADVTGQTNTNAWAKAGVMFRATTDPNSIFIDLVVTPGEGLALEWRTSTGGTCSGVNVTTVTAPRWVKLVRSGNSFTGFYSSNGTTWTQIGTAVTLQMGTPALAGLAVTSHNIGALDTATFSNVSIT